MWIKMLRREELKVRVDGKSFHNLDHYQRQVKYIGHKAHPYDSFVLDHLEYDENGEPIVVNFQPITCPYITIPPVAKRKIRIPVSRLREEVEFLREGLRKYREKKRWERPYRKESDYKIFDPKEMKIEGLLKQRTRILEFDIDMPKRIREKYSGLIVDNS